MRLEHPTVRRNDTEGEGESQHGVGYARSPHGHEHLVQSIAYARMQGVVSPWTGAQMAAEKDK